MAVIITVHGTNDSGETTGEGWWQRGGALHRDLERLVVAKTEKFSFEPLKWNGKNSEDSRFEAGHELSDRLQTLLTNNIPHCIIGHSHGGSVTAHALRELEHRTGTDVPLPRWIVVGTPFIETIQDRFRFTRLKNFGKAAYVSFAMTLAAALFTAWLLIFREADNDRHALGFVVAFLASSIGFLLLFRKSEHPKMSQYSGRLLPDSERMRGSLLHLRHRDDEALNSLMATPNVRLRIFGPSILYTALSSLAIFAIPLLVVVLAFTPDYYDALARWLATIPGLEKFGATTQQLIDKDGVLLASGRRLFNVFLIVLMAPPVFLLINVGLIDFKDEAQQSLGAGLGLLFGLCLLLAFNYMIQLFVSILSQTAGRFLSNQLDGLATTQVRAAAFGDDIQGEKASLAFHSPASFATPPKTPELPRELSDQISEFSDQRASETFAKLRRQLIELQEGSGNQNVVDWLTGSVTWRELIHTSYFEIQEFRKLVAYAVSQVDGFAPSDAFLADPDYPLVRAWFEELSSMPDSC